jgi:5'-deoxynucleotidase
MEEDAMRETDACREGGYPFFALMSRLRYINRWQLMRCSRDETLAEHSLEVAMIAHVLCTLANVRHGHALDADRAAVIGLYHDVSEIITGDMPTPVKYRNGRIRDAYHDVEAQADQALLDTLPNDLQAAYKGVFESMVACEVEPGSEDAYLLRLVKAADKISALVKCEEELESGSKEFADAAASTRARVDELAAELPEVADYMREFFPSYGNTLDALLR